MYRNVILSLNYVPHCVPSNQTASCVESAVQQPFNRSWQTSQRRDSHTSLLLLPTPGLITSAHSTSQFVGLPRRGGDFSSLVSLLVLSMFTRRGTPAMIWSDNGTNFIGAEKELRECVEKWNTLNIATELAHNGIKWRFNPPSAPLQGVLYTILGTRRLTDEVLNNTFFVVEYALNSRPLTPVSADPSDLGAIRPNQFLLGNQATGNLSIVGVDEFDHRKRYSRAQSYANAIWARWLKEYVPALNRRSKWQTPAEQHLKVGDLV